MIGRNQIACTFFIPSCAFQNHQYRYSVYFCRKIAKEAKVNFGAYISEMTHSRWRNLSIAPFGIYITFMATDLHFFETCLSNRCDIHIRSHGTVIIIFASRRNDLEDKLCSGLHSPHISHFLHLPHFHFLHLRNFQKPSQHFNIPYIHYPISTSFIFHTFPLHRHIRHTFKRNSSNLICSNISTFQSILSLCIVRPFTFYICHTFSCHPITCTFHTIIT